MVQAVMLRAQGAQVLEHGLAAERTDACEHRRRPSLQIGIELGAADEDSLVGRVGRRERGAQRTGQVHLDAAADIHAHVRFRLLVERFTIAAETLELMKEIVAAATGGLVIFGCWLAMRRLGRVPEPRRSGSRA